MSAATAERRSATARLRSSRGAVGGLLDAGLAAVSTFLMGTAVVRLLPTADLALYSSMFQAFVLCALLPMQLVYIPSQLSANMRSGETGRMIAPDLIRDLRSHWPIVVAAALVAALMGLPLADRAGWATYAWAAVGVLLMTVTSPHQSHSRSVLHVSGRHGGAALASSVTLAVQVLLLAVPVVAITVPAFAPVALGALFLGTALGNAAGSGVALLLLRRVEIGPPSDTPFRVRIGFLTAEGIGQLAGYLSVLIVAGLLGTVAVARLEAARIVASPMQILVVGLLAYLVPRAIRAVSAGDHPAFRRVTRVITVVIAVAGALYAVFVLLASGLIGRLLGRTVSADLAAARVVVTAIDSSAAAPGMSLLARRRVVAGNVIALIANAAELALMPVTLLLLGPLGMPAAQAVGSGIRLVGLTRIARGLFRPGAPAADPTE